MLHNQFVIRHHSGSLTNTFNGWPTRITPMAWLEDTRGSVYRKINNAGADHRQAVHVGQTGQSQQQAAFLWTFIVRLSC